MRTGALAALVAGCAPTSVDVVFTADADALAGARELEVTVRDRAGLVRLRAARPLPETPLPASVRVEPEGEADGGRFEVAGVLRDEMGASLATVRGVMSFAPGERLEVRLHFDAACTNVDDCGDERTCAGGACAGACVTPHESGAPSRTPSFECAPDPTRRTARAVVVATEHACLADADGAVWCWGSNAEGQLGGGTIGAEVVAPARVAGVSNATALVAGSMHTCALVDGGRVFCWGRSGSGQLGVPEADNPSAPIEVALEPAVDLSSGSLHACALAAGGAVECWGHNEHGQIGDGTRAVRREPTRVVELDDAIDIESYNTTNCAIRRDRTVACWGRGMQGVLGTLMTREMVDGIPIESRPVAIAGLDSVESLTMGYDLACARREAGDVVCWGRNMEGELGRGPAIGCTPGREMFAPVDGLAGVVEIASGHYHACAITTARAVVCWGRSHFAQLGHECTDPSCGDPTRCPSFGAVPQLEATAFLAAGGDSTCAVSTSGALRCWGDNTFGQLGNGAIGPSVVTPARVIGF